MPTSTREKPGLITHSEAPLNAEPPLDQLRRSMITAPADFYVRCHGNIPDLGEADHRLRVDGLVRTPLDLSMEHLRTGFPQRQVVAVLQCAGNRRADLQPVRQTSGDPWAAGAIGNAEWTGVALADVLRAAGAADDASHHVAFEACDEVDIPGEGRFPFGVSIPMAKAMSPAVLLAWAMNGERLLPEHGYPLRVVVPGYAGVRSPKWLRAITVQDGPSLNHMQQRDYRLFPPNVTQETVDWTEGTVINDMPLNAAICEPAGGATFAPGRIVVKGYAVATQRQVVRVDVSGDGGRTWSQAGIEHDAASPWSWTFWTATLDLPAGEHELAVRAWDSAGQTQPSLPDDTWNLKGYLSAAWHRIRVVVR